MSLFTLIKEDEIHLAPGTKVIPAKEFAKLITATEMLKKTKEQEVSYRIEVAKECEVLKEQAADAGFEEGLKRWNEHIALLEEEITKVRQEMEQAIVPLALTAVKKIIGRELETKPDSIVDIVATALKTVLHHRRVTIYVNQLDLDRVEAQKTKLKSLFEHLESLSISSRADVSQGGCIIETEAGIINAQLENQLLALESAFKHVFQNRKKEGRAKNKG